MVSILYQDHKWIVSEGNVTVQISVQADGRFTLASSYKTLRVPTVNRYSTYEDAISATLGYFADVLSQELLAIKQRQKDFETYLRGFGCDDNKPARQGPRRLHAPHRNMGDDLWDGCHW